MDAPKTTDPRIRDLLDRLTAIRAHTLLVIDQTYLAINLTEQLLRQARAELAYDAARRDRGGLSYG